MRPKVAIIGCGAIGAYILWGLENQCTVIAQGSRKEKLVKDGILINDVHYDLDVKTYQEAGIQDIVFVSTKYSALQDVASNLHYLVGKHTIVLSLLNGVDSEEILSRSIDKEHIVYSLMRIASKRVDNRIYFDEKMIRDIYFGSLKKQDSKIDFLCNFFSQTKIPYHALNNILQDMWTKYASNISNNLPQAILGVPSILYDSEHGKFMADMLWNEVYQVAKAKGIDIQEQPVSFDSVPKSSKFSTLQDIEAKRHTEVDMFLGVLLRYAKELSIPCPYSEYTLHIIKAIEEKNDGKFDIVN